MNIHTALTHNTVTRDAAGRPTVVEVELLSRSNPHAVGTETTRVVTMQDFGVDNWWPVGVELNDDELSSVRRSMQYAS